VYDKSFSLKRVYNIPQSDDWFSALTLHEVDGQQVLFAGTHNGFIHQYNQYSKTTGFMSNSLFGTPVSNAPVRNQANDTWSYAAPFADNKSSKIGQGFEKDWDVYVGEFTGDGIDDLIVRRPDEQLWIYPWDSVDWSRVRQIGSGWKKSWEPHVGEFTGDGIDDLIVWRPNEELWLYEWTGNKWGEITKIGSGWKKDWKMHIGDFTGDGVADLIAYRPDGTVWLHPWDGEKLKNARQITDEKSE
ncbi:MAG: VCBS repeat-containing protein, partial [Calditrichota bacterium]